MLTEVRSRPLVGGLMKGILAPAVWLEKARGRRRLALLGLYALIASVGGLLLWRALSLRGLPDVGDPFDVAAFAAVEVSDAENAFVLYRQASARHKRISEVDESSRAPIDWVQASPEIRRWVEDNREAIELYRLGSERPRALHAPPGDVSPHLSMQLVQDLRDFARLGTLEASRREQDGDMGGAWALYRAVFRASRHVRMHGGAIQGYAGSAMLKAAAGGVPSWAADVRVDPAMLREALDDIAVCEAMTPPASEMFKIEYLSLMKALDRPGPWTNEFLMGDGVWHQHLPKRLEVGLFLYREPERSRRVARSIFANWLAQADKPLALRAKPAQSTFFLYEADPGTPGPARALPPESLDRWFKSTMLLSRILPRFDIYQQILGGDRPALAALKVVLAEQLYRREHGDLPKSLGTLVGPYLESLPEGYDAGDGPTSPTAADAAIPAEAP